MRKLHEQQPFIRPSIQYKYLNNTVIVRIALRNLRQQNTSYYTLPDQPPPRLSSANCTFYTTQALAKRHVTGPCYSLQNAPLPYAILYHIYMYLSIRFFTKIRTISRFFVNRRITSCTVTVQPKKHILPYSGIKSENKSPYASYSS